MWKRVQNTLGIHVQTINFKFKLFTPWGLLAPYGDMDLGRRWFRHWAITRTNVDLIIIEFCSVHISIWKISFKFTWLPHIQEPISYWRISTTYAIPVLRLMTENVKTNYASSKQFNTIKEWSKLELLRDDSVRITHVLFVSVHMMQTYEPLCGPHVSASDRKNNGQLCDEITSLVTYL